jgi:phage baseplate assembly protein W
MPIPQTIRVNPLDLQKNIAIGVSLPFNGPGVFNKTYTTKDQIKSNLINLLLTEVGERVMNPNFGCDLRRFLFEGITENNMEEVAASLQNSISIFIPEITVTNIDVAPTSDTNTSNTLNLTVNYYLNISQTPDQITVQFN